MGASAQKVRTRAAEKIRKKKFSGVLQRSALHSYSSLVCQKSWIVCLGFRIVQVLLHCGEGKLFFSFVAIVQGFEVTVWNTPGTTVHSSVTWRKGATSVVTWQLKGSFFEFRRLLWRRSRVTGSNVQENWRFDSSVKFTFALSDPWVAAEVQELFFVGESDFCSFLQVYSPHQEVSHGSTSREKDSASCTEMQPVSLHVLQTEREGIVSEKKSWQTTRRMLI